LEGAIDHLLRGRRISYAGKKICQAENPEGKRLQNARTPQYGIVKKRFDGKKKRVRFAGRRPLGRCQIY
jgi:hypothetical protein